MKFSFRHQGAPHSVDLQVGREAIRAHLDGSAFTIEEIEKSAAKLCFNLDGEPQQLYWAKDGKTIWLHLDGRTYQLEREAGAASVGGGQAGDKVLRAPMPGQVQRVMVAAGDRVATGEMLLVLEAMKMEMRVQAPRAGRVVRLAVAAGESVEKDQILVELDGEDTDE